jgi:hypothetical protein
MFVNRFKELLWGVRYCSKYFVGKIFIGFLLAMYEFSISCNAKNLTNSVYVAAIGDDSNLGTDSIHPLRTIAAAIKTGNKNIMLRRGDVFYENVILSGKNLKAYGVGKKPVLCGWKYLTGAKWIRYEGNVWRLDLESNTYSGRLTSKEKFHNDIGLIRNVRTGEMYGVKKQYIFQKDCPVRTMGVQMNTWLTDNMDFAQSSNCGSANLKSEDFKYLYLLSSKNPNDMFLEVSTYRNGIIATNSLIEGIKIEGFSCHGISARENTKISNCDIEYVGGAQQINYDRWVRYGNGIEFGISTIVKNGYVAYNNISHTFDCGATIQGSNYVGAYPKNIIFEHNRIYNCRQAFEYFLNNDDKKTGEKYDCVDCYFRNNICIDNGNNGFGTSETRDGQILSYQDDYVSSIKIENNTFVGGPSLYFAIHPENIRFGSGNVFYLTEGTTLWTPYHANNKIVYDSKNMNGISKQLADKGVEINKVKLVKVTEKKLGQLKEKYMKKSLH